MTMTRAQHRKQLVQGLHAIYGFEYNRYPEEWKRLFDTEKSSKAYEEDVLMTGFGAAQVKGEGAPIDYDQGGEGWVSRYVHETIALGFALTQEAEEDNLYGSLGPKYTKALARSFQHTKEVKGAAVFNNAFNASYKGGDGKTLCATDHPLRGGGSLGNKFAVAADLSEASLEEALQTIADWTDDRGIPIALQARSLHIPTELEYVAERLLKSPYRPGVADNDINALKSMGKIPGGHVVNHRFVDPDAWFLRTDCPDGMKHFQRVAMSTGTDGDFDSGNLRYKGRERYSFGWSDWRATFGTEGA